MSEIIKNLNNETLDYTVEGKCLEEAKTIFLFCHGFGTDKHECGIFDDLSRSITSEIEDSCTFRFSYSGFGESEGEGTQITFNAMVEDLKAVLQYVVANKSKGIAINFVCFSLGNYVASRVLTKKFLQDVRSIFCLNIPEHTVEESLRSYFTTKSGAFIDESGIWHIPRSTGATSLINDDMWSSIKAGQPLSDITYVTNNYNTYLIRALDDDVVNVNDVEINKLPFNELIGVKGNHNLASPDDRKGFVKTVANLVAKLDEEAK